MSKKKVVKISRESAPKWRRLSVRFDETARVGVGADMRMRYLRALSCSNSGFGNGGRRGGGAEIPVKSKGSLKVEFAKISAPSVIKRP